MRGVFLTAEVLSFVCCLHWVCIKPFPVSRSVYGFCPVYRGVYLGVTGVHLGVYLVVTGVHLGVTGVYLGVTGVYLVVTGVYLVVTGCVWHT